MASQPIKSSKVSAELIGDVTSLAERIGSPGGLSPFIGVLATSARARITDLASLRRFLDEYQRQRLVPVELPSICRAYAHASRHEARELIALDRHLAAEPPSEPFATASRRVGKTQLKRLRPLRDQRVVQRYLSAIEAGEAHGWHTVVYGLILSVYSLPLRQGLFSYAQQTTHAFVCSAAGAARLTDSECDDLVRQIHADLHPAVETVVAGAAVPNLAAL